MSLADDVSAALPGLRAEAEALMVDTCKITKPGGKPVWDDDAGEYVDPEPVTVYEGKCRIRNAYPAPQSVQAGQVVSGLDIVIISIPVGEAGGIERGCEWELTASPNDPDSVGMRASITADHVQTFSTACRFPAQIVSRHV
ncbi:MAG TPA: DUF6093 family protein [Solirubrobacteraceae bacterium]|nr:DUF6093 family protein [Solirubrobacteraceae bacterium]